MEWKERFRKHLDSFSERNLLRKECPLVFRDACHGRCGDGRLLFAPCSNDYLGLRFHGAVRRAAAAAADVYGGGAGGARAVTGTAEDSCALEAELAAFKGGEAALLFGSGYVANVGLFSAIGASEDIIFSDSDNHASIIDGCRLSRARRQIYDHCNVSALEKLLLDNPCGGQRWIVTEGVFSTDGTTAPLPALLQLAKAHGAVLVVDDAHGTGVLGRGGRGTLDHFGLAPENSLFEVGTLSKALGSFGGFVCGPRLLVDFLRQGGSRPFLCATALPPASIAAARSALGILSTEYGTLHQNFLSNRDCAREIFPAISFPAAASGILPLPIGDERKAADVAAKLYGEGIYLREIRYPSLPLGRALLRLTVSAAYDGDEWRRALRSIARLL
jgi:8-amino-7-oxononanoate synthase